VTSLDLVKLLKVFTKNLVDEIKSQSCEYLKFMLGFSGSRAPDSIVLVSREYIDPQVVFSRNKRLQDCYTNLPFCKIEKIP
jgi:hypothetical protein